MSYYGGSRRFALGGKGWTIVLGTTVSVSYIRYQARAQDQHLEQAHHQLRDRHGNLIPFADQPKEVAGEKEDIVLRLYRQCPEVPLPNMYVAGGIFTGLWAYRMSGTLNRLMTVRYADIGYQLRRPDVLANKVVALKYLALPLAFIPAVALLGFGYSWWFQAAQHPGEPGVLQRQARALKEALKEPCLEASRLARDVISPVGEEIRPLASIAIVDPSAAMVKILQALAMVVGVNAVTCSVLCSTGGHGTQGFIVGTAPACKGTCADCRDDHCYQVEKGSVDDYGDGCWTGHKVCCCSQAFRNNNSTVVDV